MAELLRNPDVLIAIITTAGAVIVGVVALFKGGDLLQLLRQRKIFRLRGKLQHTCPHVEFSIAGEQPQFTLLFFTTVGTIDYYCQLCGCRVNEHDTEKLAAFWSTADAEVIKEAIKNFGEARKLRKKLDSLGNWASA